jgi:hypothetical protein
MKELKLNNMLYDHDQNLGTKQAEKAYLLNLKARITHFAGRKLHGNRK